MDIYKTLSNPDNLPFSIKVIGSEIDVEHGDAGIGAYEYFGFCGYDSHPYTTAESVGDLEITLGEEKFHVEFSFGYTNGGRDSANVIIDGENLYEFEGIESLLAKDIFKTIEDIENEVKHKSLPPERDYDEYD